jgi:hypothetical protein
VTKATCAINVLSSFAGFATIQRISATERGGGIFSWKTNKVGLGNVACRSLIVS